MWKYQDPIGIQLNYWVSNCIRAGEFGLQFGSPCTHEILEAQNGMKMANVFLVHISNAFSRAVVNTVEMLWLPQYFPRALPNVFSGARKHKMLAEVRMTNCRSNSCFLVVSQWQSQCIPIVFAVYGPSFRGLESSMQIE